MKRPLPFHSNFGQPLLPDIGFSSIDSTAAGSVSTKTTTSRDNNKASRSVSSSTKFSSDDETLIASLDEISFGDRIVPRANVGKQARKAFKSPQSNQQIVTDKPVKKIEKRPEPNKDMEEFFANFADTISTTTRSIDPSTKSTSHFDQFNTATEQSSVRSKETRKRGKSIKDKIETVDKSISGSIQISQLEIPSGPAVPINQNSNAGQDFAESIQNQFFSLPSVDDNIRLNNNDNEPLRSIESSSPSSYITGDPSSPGQSYSYFVLGSSSTPDDLADKLKNSATPSIASELAGQDVGSPGSVTSSIDQFFNQYSPFPQQESLRSSSNDFTPSQPENVAERPIGSNEPFSKSQFSSDIAPFIQSVSSQPPAFVPSPPILNDEGKSSSPSSSYPEPPTRVLEHPTSISSIIKPSLKPTIPAPNKYAGFIPPPSRGTSDTFSEFPRPNFSAFYPPLSNSQTVYYGGNPNEPPSLLKNNVVNFIKSNAVSGNAFKAPFEPSYPNINSFASPSPFKTTPSTLNGLQNEKIKSPSPTLNNQPIRSPALPLSNLVVTSPATKFNPPASKPSRPVTQNSVKPIVPNVSPPTPSLSVPAVLPVNYLNGPAPAKATSSTGTGSVPANIPQSTNNPSRPVYPTYTAPVNPTPPSTSLSAPKPSGFIASPAITKPLNPAVPAQVTRPIRYSQPLNQPSPPSKLPTVANKPTVQQVNNPGTYTGFSSGFVPSTPSRPVGPAPSKPTRPIGPATPIARPPVKNAPPLLPSAQVKKVFPRLTRNLAPVPVLAPRPIYLSPATLTLPIQPKRIGSRSVTSSYSYPVAQPIYYHAIVTYG